MLSSMVGFLERIRGDALVCLLTGVNKRRGRLANQAPLSPMLPQSF